MKWTDSLRSFNLNDLCIHPGLKFPTKFKWSDFEKHDGKELLYVHFRVYRVEMAQYSGNDKLLVQTF